MFQCSYRCPAPCFRQGLFRGEQLFSLGFDALGKHRQFRPNIGNLLVVPRADGIREYLRKGSRAIHESLLS